MSQVNPNQPPSKDAPPSAYVPPFRNPKNGEEKHANKVAKQLHRDNIRVVKAVKSFATSVLFPTPTPTTSEDVSAASQPSSVENSSPMNEATGSTETSTSTESVTNEGVSDTTVDAVVAENAVAETTPQSAEQLFVKPPGIKAKAWKKMSDDQKRAVIAKLEAETPAALPGLPTSETKKLNDPAAWKAMTAAAAEKALQAKAAQEKVDALAAEQASRNGDAPTESVDVAEKPATVVALPDGTVTSVNAEYDSSAETPKIATLNGEHFDAKRISDAPEDESANPGEDLVKHGSFKEMDAAEQAESGDDTDSTETGEEVSDADKAADSDSPSQETAVEEPAPPETAPVESNVVELKQPAKTDNVDDKVKAERIMEASKFYGKAFNAVNQVKLTEAYRLLQMALKAQANGNKNMVDTIFNKALAAENEAFADIVPLKKAA